MCSWNMWVCMREIGILSCLLVVISSTTTTNNVVLKRAHVQGKFFSCSDGSVMTKEECQ